MHKQTGYTLIELLVVITLMVLLLGGGVATYFQFEERQSAEVAARRLHEAFITARAKARFRERVDCPTDSVIGFRTNLRNDGTLIRVDILTICGSDRNNYDYLPEPNAVQDESLATVVYTLPNGVALESPVPATLPYVVDFFTLYGGAKLNNVDTNDTVDITVSRGSARYGFSVDRGADISPVVKLN